MALVRNFHSTTDKTFGTNPALKINFLHLNRIIRLKTVMLKHLERQVTELIDVNKNSFSSVFPFELGSLNHPF